MAAAEAADSAALVLAAALSPEEPLSVDWVDPESVVEDGLEAAVDEAAASLLEDSLEPLSETAANVPPVTESGSDEDAPEDADLYSSRVFPSDLRRYQY